VEGPRRRGPIGTSRAANLAQHSPSGFLPAKAGSQPAPRRRARGPRRCGGLCNPHPGLTAQRANACKQSKRERRWSGVAGRESPQGCVKGQPVSPLVRAGKGEGCTSALD